MTFNDVLYVKNMDLSESDRDDGEQSIWDDHRLNNAYDKALKIANAEVAKRLAMSTNTKSVKGGLKSNKPMPNGIPKSQSTEPPKWKAGMNCRAVYEADGVEYEAVLERLVFNDKECIVRFLGYDNIEIVPLSSLKPSLGKKERKQQMKEALASKLEDGYSSQSHSVDEMECSDMQPSMASTASTKKKKKSKKNKNTSKNNSFILPDISSLPMPNIAHLRNTMTMDMPIPPPPPMAVGCDDSEEQAVSSMLLSWYMSGYYTGLYQGMKRAREGRRS